MPEKNAISTFYSMVISGGSVLVIGLSSFIVNRFVKTIDDNKAACEKEIAELKGEIKERDAEFKKDMGEAFSRIRDLETIQAIIKTEQDVYKRGKNGK